MFSIYIFVIPTSHCHWWQGCWSFLCCSLGLLSCCWRFLCCSWRLLGCCWRFLCRYFLQNSLVYRFQYSLLFTILRNYFVFEIIIIFQNIFQCYVIPAWLILFEPPCLFLLREGHCGLLLRSGSGDVLCCDVSVFLLENCCLFRCFKCCQCCCLF